VKVVTDYVVALMEYVKAEVYSVRRGLFKTTTGIVIMAAAGVLACMGVALMFLSLFLSIANAASYPLASLITGAVMLVFAIIIAEIAIWLAK
jgi:hypothetical protein